MAGQVVGRWFTVNGLPVTWQLHAPSGLHASVFRQGTVYTVQIIQDREVVKRLVSMSLDTAKYLAEEALGIVETSNVPAERNGTFKLDWQDVSSPTEFVSV